MLQPESLLSPHERREYKQAERVVANSQMVMVRAPKITGPDLALARTFFLPQIKDVSVPLALLLPILVLVC